VMNNVSWPIVSVRGGVLGIVREASDGRKKPQTGLTAYAINILGTFIPEPSHAQKQSVMVEAPLKSA
jgi:hypothetical protein